MSALGLAGRASVRDPAWRATALTGAVLLGALATALAADSDGARAAAFAAAVAVVPVAVLVLGPGAVRTLRASSGRALLVAVPFLVLAAVLLAFALLLGGGGLALLAVALLSAAVGLALVAADLHERARRASARASRSPWQQMTAGERVRAVPWRTLVGGLLVTWAALLALVAFGPYVARAGAVSVLLLLGAALAVLALVGVPVLVGAAARGDSDRLAQAREDERQRVAAHLHDSVLQTLSLIQRQAADPVSVARLARHQERALRAWMAGHPEQRADTLAGALHRVVEEVEGEEAVDVEVTVLGDRVLDAPGDALVAAAREALRNAARHARGAAVVVFAELDDVRAAVYVRDDGPGFDPDAVAPERRGVRDAIVGRMAGAGGDASIESRTGGGTEVALRLPAATEPER